MNLGSVQVHRPRIPQSFVAIAQPARICLKHLRTVSADDATTLWRVNSTSAISLISPPALTVGFPFQPGMSTPTETNRCHDTMLPCCHVAMLPCCHVAMLPCCHRLSTGHGPQPPARREFPVFAAGSGATGPTVRPRGRTPPGCSPVPAPWPPTAGRRPQEPGPAAWFSPPTRPWRRPHRPEAALTRAGGAHARAPASRRAATIK